MQADEMLFFDAHREGLLLYLRLREEILESLPDARIEVKKTQISFKNRHLFAAVSFLPVRRAADRPKPCITLTLGLPARLDSPRVDAALEPYPGRWTHHITLGDPREIDEELMGWIRDAAAFSNAKR